WELYTLWIRLVSRQLLRPRRSFAGSHTGCAGGHQEIPPGVTITIVISIPQCCGDGYCDYPVPRKNARRGRARTHLNGTRNQCRTRKRSSSSLSKSEQQSEKLI